jgi:hypothetical protein
MVDARTVWLVYQECGEYSDYTFTPLSVADDEESAARAAEAFARAWAAKNGAQARGSGAVWYAALDLSYGDTKFSYCEVRREQLTPEERVALLGEA